MTKSHSEHHGQAAYHQESSTKHHRAAELDYGSGDHKKATLGALLTNVNAAYKSHHAEMAADARVEHHGMKPAEPHEHIEPEAAAQPHVQGEPEPSAEPMPRAASKPAKSAKSAKSTSSAATIPTMKKPAPKAKPGRAAARAR